MKPSIEKKYEGLSPFELKDKLISIAKAHPDRAMLNAGRGNPNWVATVPRQAFCQLGLFSSEESQRVVDLPAIGGAPDKQGVATRFDHFLERHETEPGAGFLKRASAFLCEELKMDPDGVVFELVDAMTGDHYPEPDRILPCCEKIIRSYLKQEIFSGDSAAEEFDLFATEGGTAAMDYVFRSLMENKLLHKGDTIAMGTPIFTPYIEIPRLSDYRFVELELKQDEDARWQYPDAEIDKLLDPAVKIFFLVNPANPASVAVAPATLERIAHIVKTKRRALIIVTDDVYGTFVNGFRSLAAAIPENTILVYSFSKYFGATGWRLGVIGIHENNSFDKRIAAFPEKERSDLNKRYSTVALNPARMKFIDRMVAESRSVALHHTAGLSTPQQVMMALFALQSLTDKDGVYKKAAQSIVLHRYRTLYEAIGIPVPEDPLSAHYYTTIDVPKLAKQRYGDDFAGHLVKDHEPIDFVVRLSEKKSVVLMDGGGFDAPDMSVRVSLANLPNRAYEAIGRGISELLEEYHRAWKGSGK